MPKIKQTKKVEEICYNCGQIVDKEIWLKHTTKELKAHGLPSLAKVLKMVHTLSNKTK